VGGFVLYGLGAAVSRHAGAILDLDAYFLGQGAITAFQLMTHYANDYFDLRADQANRTPTRWSGGSRVLAEGALPPRVALVAAVVLAALGCGMTAALARHVGGAPALLALVAGLLAWAYSAPPFSLHSRGLGELTTAAVVTGLVPLTGYAAQTGAPGLLPLLAVLPLAGLQFAMLLAIEFPDAAGDAAAGKRTLVVRLGPARSAALYRAVLIAVYGAVPILVIAGLPPAAALALALPAPIAAWQFSRLGRGIWADPRGWVSLAFSAVALLVASAAAELVAFVLL
jgi:1,4-dihydroxy-2-naphthoate octaprenyltransferase